MMLDIGKVKKIGLFASGVLFGTAGVKVLGSKDAKKFYINCLAAGLRAKDCVMTTATNIQENAEDILAEAKEINEQRAKAEEATSVECSEAYRARNERGAAGGGPSCSVEAIMKFQIKHECRGRIRVQAVQQRMTLEQADMLEAWLLTLPQVEFASVHERTRCAVIEYQGDRKDLLRILAVFSYQDHALAELVPVHSSRALNRAYEE